MRIKVKIPATTANLGPGFDTLGLALDLYNYLTLEVGEKPLQFVIKGLGTKEISRSKNNIAYQAVQKAYEAAGKKTPNLKITLENHIPITRGLGSSASIIVGGIYAANELMGRPLTDQKMYDLALDMEGHPDNIMPAFAGGLVVSAVENKQVYYKKIDFPEEIKMAVVIPEFHLSTKKAREVLPSSLSYKDTVYNIGHSTLMMTAFLQQDYDLFAKMMQDKIHQPYRSSLIPGFKEVCIEAQNAGAMSTVLSGAGPTVVAFVKKNKAQDVLAEMRFVFDKFKVKSSGMILHADQRGIRCC